MALELECTIRRKLDLQQGQSARGPWVKQEFVVEYQDGNFPNTVCANVWGQDKVNDLARYNVGEKVKISFNISSREFNNRWYTDIRVWRITSASSDAPAAIGVSAPAAPAPAPANNGYQPSAPAGFAPSAPAPTAADAPEDDLPF